MEMKCREVPAAVRGKLLQEGDPECRIARLVTDSREVREGDFFIPLAGEKTDGHLYIGEAASRGACGCFVAAGHTQHVPAGRLTVVMVEDTLLALQQLAAGYRDRFTVPVVAVTGSTGKTTTKDLIAAILSSRLSVLKTEGNLNNQIGLPLMLSRLEAGHGALVLEMGMSGFLEISLLASLARPDIGVITNIGESHLEMLGSRENIARAKCELLEHLPAGGVAVLNGDEPLLMPYAGEYKGRVVTFGFSENSTIYCKAVEIREGKRYVRLLQQGYEALEVQAPLPGRHNIYNLMAAVAVGRELGLTGDEIASGLKNISLSGMRLEVVNTPLGVTVINDAYNASPSSTEAAIDVLVEEAGEAGKIAVLGDMLELGSYEEEGHRRVGRLAAKRGLDALVLLGKRSVMIAAGAREEGYPAGRIHFSHSHEDAARFVAGLAKAGDWVLVKGSRGMRMEQILSALSATEWGEGQ